MVPLQQPEFALEIRFLRRLKWEGGGEFFVRDTRSTSQVDPSQMGDGESHPVADVQMGQKKV